MRLADFIVTRMEPILMEWEVFARGILPGAKMDTLALRDNAEDILRATVQDMGSAQTISQQSAKSRGKSAGAADGAGLNEASDRHGADRLGSGFDLMQVVSEFRALRASVLGLWRDSAPEADERDVEDITRFNESIDQSLGRAVSSYTRRVDQARDMFLAILGHDLRNPLNSIGISAAMLPQMGNLDTESVGFATQISTNVQVMGRMIGDLLDYTRTRLGAGMPVTPAAMDLTSLCRELFNEFRSAHPGRTIRFLSDGDLRGNWDTDRLRQAISNLLGNAIQHSAENAPIALRLKGETADVVVEVYNGGSVIPAGDLTKIFDPLVRGLGAGQQKHNRPGSIGLGLYIAREIARSHGGRIDVTSSAQAGTTFTVRLPRHCLVKPGQPILDEQHVLKL